MAKKGDVMCKTFDEWYYEEMGETSPEFKLWWSTTGFTSEEDEARASFAYHSGAYETARQFNEYYSMVEKQKANHQPHTSEGFKKACEMLREGQPRTQR